MVPTILLVAMIECFHSSGENTMISRVENNLLPPVLIEGEQPYNLHDRMAYYHVPGLSIAVIKDFEIEWVKHYGLRDADLGEPVTDSTIFCVGSLSKAAAAATILHLVYLGRVGLDDNVNAYLKSWKVPENEFTKKSAVTIRRLMNHSGGFAYSPPHVFPPTEMPTLLKYLNGEPPLNIPPARIDYLPGSAFRYANAGFSALQILAEDASGQCYPDFAKAVLFDVLGMKYSTFEQPLPKERELSASAGHNPDGTVQEIKRYAYPALTAGGLWSTAEEYAKFVIEIQRTLRGKSNLIMSRELARQMTSPHEAKEYGFGVFMRYTDEVTYFGHIGDLRGFVAGFMAHPTDGYGAVVMTNSSSGINLIREIISGIAKVYEWQTYPPKPYTRYKLESNTMAEYAARYRIDFDNACTVYEENGCLFYTASEADTFQLYPISKDTLVSKERLGRLVFVADSGGKVVKCITHFSDDIGRLPEKAIEAIRMADGERTPLEILLSGEIDKAIESYKARKRDFADDFTVSEGRLNSLGYRFLSQKRVTEALAVLELSTQLYPESGNCWDSYAEALLTAGKKEEALRNYQKALELDPFNSNAAKWIGKLRPE